MDIAEVKRRYGDRLCLVGYVNCGLLDSGSEADIKESARYALRHGMPLSSYELMLDVWRQEGNYP